MKKKHKIYHIHSMKNNRCGQHRTTKIQSYFTLTYKYFAGLLYVLCTSCSFFSLFAVFGCFLYDFFSTSIDMHMHMQRFELQWYLLCQYFATLCLTTCNRIFSRKETNSGVRDSIREKKWNKNRKRKEYNS